MYEARQNKEKVSRTHSLSNRKPKVQSENTTTIQRYVSFLNQSFTNDFVENVSIDYALKRGGPPVRLFHNSDFHEVKNGESVYLVGHGGTESAGIYGIDQIYKGFNDKNRGLKNNNVNIIFTSCHAGEIIAPELKRRLDEKFSKQGKYRGNIIGAKGPSIKSDETGNEIKVVNGSKIKEAGLVQTDTEKLFIESYLKPKASEYIEHATKELTSVKVSNEQKQLMIKKIQESSYVRINHIIQDIVQIQNLFSISIEDKAKFVTGLTSGFYKLFIDKLEKLKLLVKNGVYESDLADRERYYNKISANEYRSERDRYENRYPAQTDLLFVGNEYKDL